MRNLLIAIGALALTATPALAQAPVAKDAPKSEMMKDGMMKCCKKDKDGKMVCEMMDHSKMDHAKKDAAASDGEHKDHKPQ